MYQLFVVGKALYSRYQSAIINDSCDHTTFIVEASSNGADTITLDVCRQ